MTNVFLARRNGKGNYSLTVNGDYFGSIYRNVDGKITGGSFTDEEVRAAHRRLCMNGMTRITLADHLAIARLAWEAVEAERQEENDIAAMEAEQEIERMMEAHLEYDPEADAFEEWERRQGKLSYEEMRDLDMSREARAEELELAGY
jgi:hypothetical protein